MTSELLLIEREKKLDLEEEADTGELRAGGKVTLYATATVQSGRKFEVGGEDCSVHEARFWDRGRRLSRGLL